MKERLNPWSLLRQDRARNLAKSQVHSSVFDNDDNVNQPYPLSTGGLYIAAWVGTTSKRSGKMHSLHIDAYQLNLPKLLTVLPIARLDPLSRYPQSQQESQ
jgi:hypothetical protein